MVFCFFFKEHWVQPEAFCKNRPPLIDSSPHSTSDFATINQGLCKCKESVCTESAWLLLLNLNIAWQLKRTTLTGALISSFSHLPFVFIARPFFLILSSFSPPSPPLSLFFFFFIPAPCSAGDLWMAANGRVESPSQPLSLPDIHTQREVMQRDWDAQLKVEQRATKAAANGYTLHPTLRSGEEEREKNCLPRIKLHYQVSAVFAFNLKFASICGTFRGSITEREQLLLPLLLQSLFGNVRAEVILGCSHTNAK